MTRQESFSFTHCLGTTTTVLSFAFFLPTKTASGKPLIRALSPTVYRHKPSCRPTTLPVSVMMSPGKEGRYESGAGGENDRG